MTEAQGTQLIELSDSIKEFVQQAIVLTNAALYAIFAGTVALVCLSAFRAVRRG